MKFEIVKLRKYSGSRASIYSVYVDDESETLFDRFVRENMRGYPAEVADILDRIETIGWESGAIEAFFRKDEGKPGQGIVALYDKPDNKLRLYCLHFGKWAILLGGGGPKNVATLQEDPKLKSENYLLRKISDAITQKIKDKDLRWDGNELTGNFVFDNFE